MTPELLEGILLGLGAVTLLVIVILAVRVELRGSRVDTLLADHGRRISVLEEQNRSAPTHADLAGIRDRIGALGGQMLASNERLSMQMDMTRSIQKHLLGDDK